jgi:hypothetical protein
MSKSKRRSKEHEIEMFIARVDGLRRSYFISENDGRNASCWIDDEAMLEIAGCIEQATDRLRGHVGEKIEISLLCAQRYQKDGAPEGGLWLASLSLRKDRRAALAYLPPQPFWALPAMLEGNARYVQAQFERVRYGSARIVSLHFGSIETIMQ